MQYGHFDDARREYVITNPKTPVKWINYIGTLAFGGFVDHTGGALLCKGDPALNRILKYIPQLPASEFKGESCYLRLHEPEGYRVFSPFFVPTLDRYDLYECHVGLGYTRIVSEFYGIRAEVTIFVPEGEAREVRDFRITNLRPTPVKLDAVPVVEYTHFDALKQLTNADWVPQTMQSRIYCEADGLKTLQQYAFMNRERAVNFFTANLPISSFESDRARFLGDHEYGTWMHPLSLDSAELSNYEAHRGDNIGALLIPLGEIAPGATVRLITQLGQESSLETALPGIQKFRDPATVDVALSSLAVAWERRLTGFQVSTPESDMDRMLNVHNPRQCFITLNWSRYLSLYQLGFGARGIGFRDSAQDAMGALVVAPAMARALLEKLLHVQMRNGSAKHQLNPLTMVATEGDSREVEEAPHYYSDDHLWIVLAVAAYLKETGDFAFLEQQIPYYDKDRAGLALESGSVLDHLQRALAFTAQDKGAHGLPLLGFADWNDTVNLRKGAESLFSANLYGKALLEMIDLQRHLGQADLAALYEKDYAVMRDVVNAVAWDGEWYVRYFDFDGTPLGSHQNSHGQIYVNGQSWPIISGFATPERAVAALESVYKKLNTSSGIKLSGPGFDGFDPTKGGITTYPPGAKENGGIFLHANPWMIIAEALMGHAERAFEYYRQINPAAKNDRIDEFECEPYVYPQNILGDEHPQFGLGRNSWLSGTASWTYQAGTQYLLGIRPDYAGLRIDPCIPAEWDGFKAVRRFRGADYEIAVRNPAHVGRGVAELIIDGTPHRGNLIPAFGDGLRHQVVAILG